MRVPDIASASAKSASVKKPAGRTPPPADGLDELDLAGGTTMPKAGDTYLGFKLVEELGRGAFAKVFLAQQEILAGRQVALKITFRPTREAERLARLQHTNVVPVYSVHSAPPAQVICMPYLGRVTINDLLRAFRQEHPSREAGNRRTSGTRKGASTAATGSAVEAQNLSADPNPTTTDTFVGSPVPLIGRVPQVLQLLAKLADGLAHAHTRGILHLDLKPANVLLADTGEPMLLDFNLSFDTTSAQRDIVGGTVPYMAPEQLVDLRSRGRGKVDGRTDLYSLGVMAYEMLTGAVPFPISAKALTDFDALISARRAGAPPLREKNPAVTPAVEAIVRKLLDPDPARRYQTAADLKTDIDRHLANQPLLFAREPSLRERAAKWRRRNPRLLGRLVAAALFVGLVGCGIAAYQLSAERVQTRALVRAADTQKALGSLRVDLVATGDSPYRARGIVKATELLAAYGLPDEVDWKRRGEFGRLPAGAQPAAAADLGELLLLLAHAKWQEGRLRGDADRREAAAFAFKLNRLARDCFPPDARPPFLVQQARELAAALGEPAPDEQPGTPATARDHFFAAASMLAEGKYRGAIDSLEKVIAAQPNHGAAQLCLGYCRQLLGEYVRAVERYDMARVLLPDDPRPFFNRGTAYGQLHRPDLAEPEFTKGIDLDPASADAFWNRAVARMYLKRYDEAEGDLTAALAKGAPAFQVYSLRAYIRGEKGDEAGAEKDRAALLALKPERDADYLIRGSMKLKSDPEGALADARAAAEMNPRSTTAYLTQAHILGDKLKDNDAAMAVLDRAAKLFPEYAPVVAGRAVILARRGDRTAALAEAGKARALSNDPGVTYQVTCVYALTAATNPDDRATAIDLLLRAYREGFKDVSKLDLDPDLATLRAMPDYPALTQAIRTIVR